MKGFSVIDTFGNLKLVTSGALLPDPVTVVHGGTGLIDVAQGDLLYASADGVLARLAKDAAGLRVVANTGVANNPRWVDPVASLAVLPYPTLRKLAWNTTSIGASTPAGVVWAGTPGAAITGDASGSWTRYATSAAIGASNGWRTTADWCYLDHAPLVLVSVRTGSVITNTRFWITISNAATFFSNADDQHLLKGVGFRYASATDGGLWVPWSADATTQTIGAGMIAVAPSTTYSFRIALTAAGASATLTINDDVSTARTVTMGAASLLTAMRVQAQVTTTDAIAKNLDFSVSYGEWN